MRRSAPWIVGALLVLLSLGALIYGAGHPRVAPDDVAKARPGDCAGPEPGNEPAYRLVPCDAAEAEFVVLRTLPAGAAAECRATPAAALWFTAGKGLACLGKRGVDPATAVNVARQGDCLMLSAGHDPLRLDCSDPRATTQVLRRLEGVQRYGEPCEDVPGTTRTHGWNWVGENPAVRYRATIDVLLCIGPTRRARAEAAASASAEAAAVHKCRFATVSEMSAAVSRAAGRTWTARSAEQDDTGCDYGFGGRDQVSVWFSGNTYFKPGSGDEVLTVDGLRAMYGPGEGNRALSVFTPTGELSVIVRLDGVGDRGAKRIGVEVFRTVRPRLP